MTTEWYYAKDRQKIGPIALEALKCLAANGDVRPSDLVLAVGTNQWQYASSVDGLFDKGTSAGVPSVEGEDELRAIHDEVAYELCVTINFLLDRGKSDDEIIAELTAGGAPSFLVTVGLQNVLKYRLSGIEENLQALRKSVNEMLDAGESPKNVERKLVQLGLHPTAAPDVVAQTLRE
jgi:hypothetical protein